MSTTTAQIPVIRTAQPETPSVEAVPVAARPMLALLMIAFVVAILGVATSNAALVIGTGLVVSIAVPIMVTSYLTAILNR